MFNVHNPVTPDRYTSDRIIYVYIYVFYFVYSIIK